MLTVAVNELQNQLSRYLQFVKNGERVLITERNMVIAEISSRKELEEESLSINEKFRQLHNAGEMILAKRNTSCAKIPATKEKLDWKSVYNDVRADRV
jgi:prevent-host-death family protein